MMSVDDTFLLSGRPYVRLFTLAAARSIRKQEKQQKEKLMHTQRCQSFSSEQMCENKHSFFSAQQCSAAENYVRACSRQK